VMSLKTGRLWAAHPSRPRPGISVPKGVRIKELYHEI
jgi:hypothetical protein